VTVHYSSGPKPPGDEIQTGGSYGWTTSKDVGAIFTDGFNLLPLTPRSARANTPDLGEANEVISTR